MLKYFVDRYGQQTMRMAGQPGKGHIEIANATEKLDPTKDVYQQMFALGYIRVVELDNEIHVDAPRKVNKRQEDFLINRRRETGKDVYINSHLALESRTPIKQAKAIVEGLIKDSKKN